MELRHGGDWAGYELEYGRMPLDFSASISPLGLPDGVRLAAVQALEQSDRYPDPLCRALRRALEEHLGVSAGRILCGGGAADLIRRAVLAVRPKAALIAAPCFSDYEQALLLTDCRIVKLYLRDREDFALTEEILPRLTEDLDMVFLAQPNNPTGLLADRTLMREILRRCAEKDILLVLDECFIDFLDEPAEASLIPETDSQHLLILRAFTKFYAMAGLRLGYCVTGNSGLMEAMTRSGQPWPVSNVAQAAGIAALREDGYAARLRELISSQRPLLYDGLKKLGCRVIPGASNFLLFRCPDRELGEKLKPRGILIRDCGNFAGLTKGWYRIAVRTGQENRRLLEQMGEVLR